MMVDVVETVRSDDRFGSGFDDFGFVQGVAAGLNNKTTADAFRLFANLKPAALTDLSQEKQDERDLSGTILVQENLVRLGLQKRNSFDGSRVETLIEQYGIPAGPATDRMYNLASIIDDNDLEIYAKREGKEASTMARIGPGANVVSTLFDPLTLGTYFIAGAGIARTTATGAAAIKAGQQASRVQKLAAKNPFLFGAGVEGAVDVAVQGVSGVIDSGQQREFDVTSLALAAVVGGGFNKVLNEGLPKKIPGFKPTREQQSFAEAADIVTDTTLNAQKRQAAQVVDGEIRGGPEVGQVAGGAVDLRRIFAPIVRIYTSNIPAIRQAAEMLGGVQTMLGRKVQDVGDIELDVTRMTNIEMQLMSPVIADVNQAFRTAGATGDFAAERLMNLYVRRRTSGIDAGDIDLDELLGESVDPSQYMRVARSLENLYVKGHSVQMKKLAGNLQDQEVRGSRLIDTAKEGNYLSRVYSMTHFGQIFEALGVRNMGNIFGGAIADAQMKDIMEYIAERLANGKKRAKYYSVKKSDAAANKARGKKGTVVEKDMTTTRLTAEEILAQFPDEIAADARAFAHQLGKGMSQRIYERMTQTFRSQADAAQINDVTEEALDDLLKNLESSKGLSEDDIEFMEALKGFVYRKKPGRKESDMGALNTRMKLNDLHKIRFSNLVDEKGKPLSAQAREQVKEDFQRILGTARVSKNDDISFEDLLNNNYQQNLNGYYHQYASQMALAKRGINKEGGATVADLIALATKQVDELQGSGVSKRKRDRAETDLNAFIYLMHTANGKSIDFAKSQMRGALDPILNASLRQYTATGKAVGIFRNISTSVHLGMVAFAQTSEALQLINTVGVRLHDIDRSTRVLREIGRIKDGSAPSELTRDMMRIGLMNEGSMSRFQGMDYGNSFIKEEGDDLLTRAYNLSTSARDYMGWMNGIKPITMIMRVVAIGRTHDRLLAGATGAKGLGKPFSPAEMKTYLTLNEDEVAKVYEAISKFAVVNKKTGGVETLRPDLWHTLGTDYAALAVKLDEKVFNFSHTIVQQSGRGYAPIMMQGGLGSTLFQFMSYASNSFEKQYMPTKLLVDRGDKGAAATRVSGAVLGSLLGYGSRLYVRSLGMSEEKRSKYLEENLTWDKTVVGTIAYMPQLSGPMIAGSIAYDMLGGAVTGDSTSIRRGFPTVPAYSSLQDIASTGSTLGRFLNPEKDVTEAQLHKLLNYATLGLANTPQGTVPRNLAAGLLGENRNVSLSPAPPRSEREETQQDQ